MPGGAGPNDTEMDIMTARTSTSGDEGELVRKSSTVEETDSGNKLRTYYCFYATYS